MTSATLKVLNEPTYPIASNSTNRKQIVIAACIGSFLIIIALLLLIEILDRTLRDANRTKRVTGFKVIGAVPSPCLFPLWRTEPKPTSNFPSKN